MKTAYLILAVVGAIVPYIFFVQFMASGAPPDAFVRQLFATAPAGGFTADLVITSIVFWIWSFGEARRLSMRGWWIYPVVNLAVGLSCAFPLFLYLREKRVLAPPRA
jgi:hypothetical protein